jgi:hypothetical protein
MQFCTSNHLVRMVVDKYRFDDLHRAYCRALAKMGVYILIMKIEIKGINRCVPIHLIQVRRWLN